MSATILSCVLLLFATTVATSTSASTTSTSVSTTTTTSPPPSTTMASGYAYNPTTGSYYKYHKSSQSWYEANATCASEGADLLVVNDGVEAEILSDMLREPRRIQKRTIARQYFSWLGLLKNSQPGGVSEWRTVHGEPLSNVLHEWDRRPRSYAEIVNKRRKEYACVSFESGNKLLYDMPCDRAVRFICEISQ